MIAQAICREARVVNTRPGLAIWLWTFVWSVDTDAALTVVIGAQVPVLAIHGIMGTTVSAVIARIDRAVVQIVAYSGYRGIGKREIVLWNTSGVVERGRVDREEIRIGISHKVGTCLGRGCRGHATRDGGHAILRGEHVAVEPCSIGIGDRRG